MSEWRRLTFRPRQSGNRAPLRQIAHRSDSDHENDREISIKVLAKYLGSIKDRDLLTKTYEGAIPDNKFSRKQYPSIPGLQMALDLLAEENPKAKNAKRRTLSMRGSSKNLTKAATSMSCIKIKGDSGTVVVFSERCRRSHLFRPLFPSCPYLIRASTIRAFESQCRTGFCLSF